MLHPIYLECLRFINNSLTNDCREIFRLMDMLGYASKGIHTNEDMENQFRNTEKKLSHNDISNIDDWIPHRIPACIASNGDYTNYKYFLIFYGSENFKHFTIYVRSKFFKFIKKDTLLSCLRNKKLITYKNLKKKF